MRVPLNYYLFGGIRKELFSPHLSVISSYFTPVFIQCRRRQQPPRRRLRLRLRLRRFHSCWQPPRWPASSHYHRNRWPSPRLLHPRPRGPRQKNNHHASSHNKTTLTHSSSAEKLFAPPPAKPHTTHTTFRPSRIRKKPLGPSSRTIETPEGLNGSRWSSLDGRAAN